MLDSKVCSPCSAEPTQGAPFFLDLLILREKDEPLIFCFDSESKEYVTLLLSLMLSLGPFFFSGFKKVGLLWRARSIES